MQLIWGRLGAPLFTTNFFFHLLMILQNFRSTTRFGRRFRSAQEFDMHLYQRTKLLDMPVYISSRMRCASVFFRLDSIITQTAEFRCGSAISWGVLILCRRVSCLTLSFRRVKSNGQNTLFLSTREQYEVM